MLHATLFITLAVVFGFFMAWGVGANDVANAMGTSVGSKALTLTKAIIVAAIFEALGALLAGGQVTSTIRSKIIDVHLFAHDPTLLIYGMLAALLAAGTWLLVATYFGWPVSTTHTIVGAVIGFALIEFGVHAIHWRQVINIVLSWIVTPLIAGALAYLLFKSVQWLIFNSACPIKMAQRYVPCYIFLMTLVLSLVTLLKGLQHLHLHITNFTGAMIAIGLSLVMMVLSWFLLRRFKVPKTHTATNYRQLEKMFAILMIFTACAMAFAHGSNDVANAIGPVAAVVAIVQQGASQIIETAPIPFWILLVGALGIVLGLVTFGYRVIATVGSHITELTPSRGFAAELATAATVVVASGLGLPISTTQTLVGAILGVGYARGIAALNLAVVRNIFMSWIITLPAGALFAIFYYHLLRWLI